MTLDLCTGYLELYYEIIKVNNERESFTFNRFTDFHFQERGMPVLDIFRGHKYISLVIDNPMKIWTFYEYAKDIRVLGSIDSADIIEKHYKELKHNLEHYRQFIMPFLNGYIAEAIQHPSDCLLSMPYVEGYKITLF